MGMRGEQARIVLKVMLSIFACGHFRGQVGSGFAGEGEWLLRGGGTG